MARPVQHSTHNINTRPGVAFPNTIGAWTLQQEVGHLDSGLLTKVQLAPAACRRRAILEATLVPNRGKTPSRIVSNVIVEQLLLAAGRKPQVINPRTLRVKYQYVRTIRLELLFLGCFVTPAKHADLIEYQPYPSTFCILRRRRVLCYNTHGVWHGSPTFTKDIHRTVQAHKHQSSEASLHCTRANKANQE